MTKDDPRPQQAEAILRSKQYVTEILVRILTLNPEEWVVQIGGEEPGPIFVQGLQEDDGCIHVELVHERVAERPLRDAARAYLAESGWQSPDSDLPNYWQFLEEGAWSPATTAAMLADSLDRVYNAFMPGVTDGTLAVMPLDVGNAVLRDDEDITAVQAPGPDQPWVTVWQEGELSPEGLLVSEAGASVTESTCEDASGEDDAYGQWSLSTLDALHRWCDDNDLPRVRLPVGVTSLYVHSDFEVWSSTTEYSPWFVYGFFMVAPDAHRFAGALRPGAPAFFMFGVAGHGMNSYALGLVARGPGYSVAIQSGWGAAYRSAEEGPMGALLVSAWNQAVAGTVNNVEGPESLILSSEMRDMSHFFLDELIENCHLVDTRNYSSEHRQSNFSDADMLGPEWFEYPLNKHGAVMGFAHHGYPSQSPVDALRTLLAILAKSRSRMSR